MTISETPPECSYVRVSNYMKIIDKEHVFSSSNGITKYLIQGENGLRLER